MKQKKSKCSPVTKAEQKWIDELQKVCSKAPKSLWLFSASSTLCVMKSPADGEENGCGDDGCGVNPENIVGYIRGIRNDGGDW